MSLSREQEIAIRKASFELDVAKKKYANDEKKKQDEYNDYVNELNKQDEQAFLRNQIAAITRQQALEDRKQEEAKHLLKEFHNNINAIIKATNESVYPPKFVDSLNDPDQAIAITLAIKKSVLLQTTIADLTKQLATAERAKSILEAPGNEVNKFQQNWDSTRFGLTPAEKLEALCRLLGLTPSQSIAEQLAHNTYMYLKTELIRKAMLGDDDHDKKKNEDEWENDAVATKKKSPSLDELLSVFSLVVKSMENQDYIKEAASDMDKLMATLGNANKELSKLQEFLAEHATENENRKNFKTGSGG